MSSLKRYTSLFLLVLGWMWIYRLPDGSALAEVKDETGLFSSSAIQQADTKTRDIKQKYSKEMLVEVFPEIPSDLRANYSPDRKDQFFADWVARRSDELKINGVYVLICRNPSQLQVHVGSQTKQRAFTPQNVEQLKTIMLTRLKNKQNDEGLLEGVDYVDRTLAANLGTASASPNSANPQYHYNTTPGNRTAAPATPNASGMHWIWWVLLIGLAIFIIGRFLRSRAPGGSMYTQRYGGGGNYPPGNYPPGGYPPQQSGGFGKGIMGGLLGGMAGGWLYDKFGHRTQDPNYTPPRGASNYTGPSTSDDTGPGFSSGGDFGGDAGGGGGDFGGGGDSGGGDSGGGASSGGDF
jgi:uncharacterized membrane protein YgcG